MSRPANPVPSYRLHKKSGRAVVTVRDHLGARRDVLLPGLHRSPESLAEYERIKAQTRVGGGRLPVPVDATPDMSLAELILRYMQEKVERYYVHPETGAPTSELVCITHALRPVNRLFGTVPATAFDSLKLDTVREAMMNGAWMNDAERAKRDKARRPIGLARGTINKHVHRIRGMFRWAVAKKLIPATLLVELQAVAALERGRSGARETEGVNPVDPATVEATLPHLPPHVADMVRVQLLTGARPGEVCAMRVRQVDRTGDVWLYRPDAHKNAWRGHKRVVAIGPKAQAILRDYLKPQLDAYLFSPREQATILKARKREERKSKVQPSQTCRAKATAKRKPGERYTVTAYNNAVRRACHRAGLPHWHPHRLRHTAALLMAREHGLEAARAALGHKSVAMSAHYAGLDLQRAAEVASKIG